MVAKKLFINPEGSWTNGVGRDSDIVLSSRIRLARNLKKYPFPLNLSHDVAQEVVDRISKAIQDISAADVNKYDIFSLKEVTPLDALALVEKHLISPDLLKKEDQSWVAVRDDEMVSIMINEEDHLRLQCFLPALQLQEAWVLANHLDDLLEQKLDFAYDKDLGYLTTCPTNLGTGLRASVMLHLPGLALNKQLDKIFSAMSKLGLTVRGMYGEGTESLGNIFQISNQVTLGISEEEMIQRLQSVVLQIVDQERQARKWLMDQESMELSDTIWRAYGVLAYSHSMSSKEMMEKLSYLRLGVDLGIVPNLTGKDINMMMLKGQAALLQNGIGKELDPITRDWERAAMLRTMMGQKSK